MKSLLYRSGGDPARAASQAHRNRLIPFRVGRGRHRDRVLLVADDGRTSGGPYPWPRPDAFLRHEPSSSSPWWAEHTVSGEVLAFATSEAAVAAIGISGGTTTFDFDVVTALVAQLPHPTRDRLDPFEVTCDGPDCGAVLIVDDAGDIACGVSPHPNLQDVNLYLHTTCPHCQHDIVLERYSELGDPTSFGTDPSWNRHIPKSVRSAAYEAWEAVQHALDRYWSAAALPAGVQPPRDAT